MPHLIVDGYNFIRRVPLFLKAEAGGLEEGRYALLLALEEYASGQGYRVTVVFDAGTRPAHMSEDFPREERFAGIDIVFSERGESADTAIVKLIGRMRAERREGVAYPDDGEIVVTDDFGIRDEALENGAFVKSPDELFRAMEKKERLRY